MAGIEPNAKKPMLATPNRAPAAPMPSTSSEPMLALTRASPQSQPGNLRPACKYSRLPVMAGDERDACRQHKEAVNQEDQPVSGGNNGHEMLLPF